MPHDRPMYRWRRMTPEERKAALQERVKQSRPWHGPPHYNSESNHYLITAACYEHQPLIGASHERMARFESELLACADNCAQRVLGYVVLPNHYHLLIHAIDVKGVLAQLGRLHGRTSFKWNAADQCRGRQVWHRAAETGIKSERHFWATLNYILHNPVHHGYVERWQDWPYSSATDYLAEIGRTEAERRWREYPILDYGKSWDPPEL